MICKFCGGEMMKTFEWITGDPYDPNETTHTCIGCGAERFFSEAYGEEWEQKD